jgi:hypothetical protein
MEPVLPQDAHAGLVNIDHYGKFRSAGMAPVREGTEAIDAGCLGREGDPCSVKAPGQHLFPPGCQIVVSTCLRGATCASGPEAEVGQACFVRAPSLHKKQTAHLLSQMGGRIAIRHHGGITPEAELLRL